MGLVNKSPMIRTHVFQKFNLANSILFWCSIYAVKASFLALYWSIFEISNGFRLAWALSTFYMIGSFIGTLMVRFSVCGKFEDVTNIGQLCYESNKNLYTD